MKASKQLIVIFFSLVLVITGVISVYTHAAPAGVTTESKYPGLFSSALKLAIPDSLPKGELLVFGKLKITQEQLNAEIGKTNVSVREQLRDNPFFILEQMAVQQLILEEAKAWMTSKKLDTKGMEDEDIIRRYIMDLTASVSVSTAEAKKFYDSNPEMFGGARFDQVETQLKSYLLNNKSQEFLETHIDNLGKRNEIKISDTWAKSQYGRALDNPVDKARRSGRPSFINFGATGCVPCDMMAPIREEIKKEYAGILNVEFINVNQQQILGARYGTSSIPVQVFFDKNGKEFFRHVGFFPKDEILKKLKEMGAIK